jgi:hypothetical protein
MRFVRGVAAVGIVGGLAFGEAPTPAPTPSPETVLASREPGRRAERHRPRPRRHVRAGGGSESGRADEGARISHPPFTDETPTTGAIAGEDFYFICNSQVDNIQDGKILDPSKLSPVRIGVVRLP